MRMVCPGMKKLSRWRSPGGQKSMCFAAQGWLQGRAVKLLRARRKSWYNEGLVQICLAANGLNMVRLAF